jgi:hypothetical protein
MRSRRSARRSLTFQRIYHIRDGQTVEEAGEGRALDDTTTPTTTL